jgi:serine/threonine protein kinase
LEELQAGDPPQIGPYLLLGRLGVGGMGRVYLARSPGGRLVAVKVIRADLAGDPGFRARFAREVAAARRVSGVFTAPVIDADPTAPMPWLATGYVNGPSLAGAVREHGALPVASVLALAAGLAEGLAAIHAAGVVHRDLKPSNVLLAADGPRVIDFGISRAVDATDLTRTGAVIGSPAFMSPEQVKGDGAVGPASDVFSLGAVLAFAATGEGPFGSGMPTVQMYRVVHGTPRLDQLPGPVRPLVERCLAKDPAQRPTATQFLAELTAAHPSAADLADWLPASILPSGQSRPDATLAPTTTEADTQHRPGSTTAAEPQAAGAVRSAAAGTPREPAAAGKRRRRWVVSAVAAVLAVGAVGAVLAVAPRHSTASSPPQSATRSGTPAALCRNSGPANGQTRIIAWKSQCVGYSESGFVFTNSAPGGEAPLQAFQDERLRFDQQQIFLLNQKADQAAKNDRPELSLVYFAGITASPDENYDSGQAEELEGLMVAQQVALEGSGPVVKVIVANGGAKMQDAVPVARMIVALAARDPGVLGVVGLDRSIEPVKQAIGLFNASDIPVVATTLSADGIGGTYRHYDPYYFQLSASNSTEANLILRYIQEIVPQYFKQPRQQYNSAGQLQARKILIYWPSANPGDLFTSTLVADLKREAPRLTGLPTLPTPQVTQHLGGQLCGAATVDIYAGRHDRPPAGSSQLDDFSAFLRSIEDDCPSDQRPFIIADDGVSRFIADPAARDQPGLGDPGIEYVTNGIQLLDTGSECLYPATAAAAQDPGEMFSSFCTTYAGIVKQLFNLPNVQQNGLDFLWTGERVGLAFDAANLFIDAEFNYETSHPAAIGRAEIPDQFISDSWEGVTGLIDFTASQHIASLPLAVVRIRISTPTATPTCGYLGQGQVFGPAPGTGPCPDGSG